jgi:hypothetical protein
LSARGDVKAIGIAGGIIKIITLSRTGAILIVTINQAVAVIVEAIIAYFGALGL